MSSIFASFKDKRLRYGTFSTLMMIVAVVIFLMINMVAGQTHIVRDMTADNMYSLSRHSRDFLRGLNTDVTIYALFSTGSEDMRISSMLDEYAAASSHIRVEYRDPVLHPAFVYQFVDFDESIALDSVIVVNDRTNKSRVVHNSDMFIMETDWQTLSRYLARIDIEPAISRAIHFVTLDDAPTIYYVTGSGEAPLSEPLVKFFDDSNYKIEELNIVLRDIPEDCDMLFITMPGRDWSTEAASRVSSYLASNGRALAILGFNPERYENLDNLFAAYGVSVGDFFIVEGDSNFHFPGFPHFVVPAFISHDITQPILEREFFTLHVFTSGIIEEPLRRASTVIEPLLVTSQRSYGKTNPETATINKEPEDIDGPFNLAVTITDTYYMGDNFTTQLVVFGSGAELMDDELNSYIGGTNWDILLNSADWLRGQSSSIYIPSKTPPSVTRLTMTQGQANGIAIASVIVLPILIIATGLTIWLRRRHS